MLERSQKVKPGCIQGWDRLYLYAADGGGPALDIIFTALEICVTIFVTLWSLPRVEVSDVAKSLIRIYDAVKQAMRESWKGWLRTDCVVSRSAYMWRSEVLASSDGTLYVPR